MSKVTLIAEVGCNHMGSMGLAIELIIRAAKAGADIVKFQKRENRLLLTPEEYDAPHPVPKNSYGESYGAHREFLEFDVVQHYRLKEECEKRGVEYSTSVWDRHSAWEIAQIKPRHIKIPSACNVDWEIYDELEGWDGHLHISLGMTTEEEQEKIVERVIGNYQRWAPVFYACTSGYPVKPSECFLHDLKELRRDLWHGLDIGYSGHHIGTDIDVGAIALGATHIERHFTHDKNAKGTDHSASLNEKELYELRHKLDTVSQALRAKYGMPAVEETQRAKLKRKV